MASILKLDGRTARGRQWKKLNTSAKPLKQGVLISKRMCSCCNQAPDSEKDIIECMSCNSSFHISCSLLIPVSDEFVELISVNPSVFWFCPSCISCKVSGPGNNASSDSVHRSEGNTVGTDVIMQNHLLSFKNQMLTLVTETMNNKLKEFADLIEKKQSSNIPNNVRHGPTGLDNQTNPAKSWSDVAGSTPIEVDTPEKPPPEKREKHVLILKPSKETSSNQDNKKDIKLCLQSCH